MLKILLVDDERTERQGIRYLIRKYNFPLEVSEAGNGKAALEYLETHPVDILLTDVKMPFMDGVELSQKARARNQKLKIIFFSAYDDFDFVKQALEVKAVNYLLKPIEVEEFETVIRQVIESCDQERKASEEAEKRREAYLELQEHSRLQMIASLLTMPKVEPEYRKQLQDNHIEFGDYLCIASLESGEDLFASQAEQPEFPFSCPYYYIRMSAREAYVVLSGNSCFPRKELERIFYRICTEFRKKQRISVIVGSVFREVSEFPLRVSEIEHVRLELVHGWDSVLFVDQMKEIRTKTVHDTEPLLKDLDTCIAARNLSEAGEKFEELVEKLEKQPHFSGVYIRHLLWELLRNLSSSFRIEEENWANQYVLRLWESDELAEWARIIREAMGEVSNEQNSADADIAVKTVLRIIHTEYSRDLTLDYLASRVFLTPVYLSALVKQQTGDTIGNYIKKCRMEKARQLLRDSTMKIADISRACGYHNPSYFNSIFKQICGMTPMQYREEHDVR